MDTASARVKYRPQASKPGVVEDLERKTQTARSSDRVRSNGIAIAGTDIDTTALEELVAEPEAKTQDRTAHATIGALEQRWEKERAAAEKVIEHPREDRRGKEPAER